jgi:peptide/nickel transport system ATP-binding protein
MSDARSGSTGTTSDERSGSDDRERGDASPLLALDDVTVEFREESALVEAVPDRVKERFGWGDRPVRPVEDVSLEVANRDVIAVIGESGSGKTTLGKTAVGLQEPTRGSVEYMGYDIWSVKKNKRMGDMNYSDIRRSLQIVHQDPGASLNPYKTVLSILKRPLRIWFPELSDADCRERILNVFRVVGLTPADDYIERYPHELSGGEKQRVALVRAMLVKPDLVLADEPVSALDPSLRVSLMDLMIKLRELFETAFLFVSHNIQHARYISTKCDGKIAVMYMGEIVEIGPAEEVLANPRHPYTKVLLWAGLPRHPDRARERLATDPPVHGVSVPDLSDPPSGCRFHTRCPKARGPCAAEKPTLTRAGTEEHHGACFRTDDAHAYWEGDSLHPDGELTIPDPETATER